ncbi:tRNA-modifying protein YgfZ [Candidatus Erwinia haradaeae]|uniref:tRNA-modifying protein YgfZ n=1 Tax=Candidatus Erwinia haradaeae TaxID=1922217 RepID=A0A451D2V7_9GAMM|nr:tRNA-modifying protein YgfZ [Candidatus Erwinia haradaeae]VFP79981.1 tRNA-modifying protein YgfZ [Candidatus Erwinia haradaeae]
MCMFTFPEQSLVESKKLPLTLISLEKWGLVNIYGSDRVRYLHSQVTLDVHNLLKTQYGYAAHCNASGKMWSNICLFHRGHQITYIERRSLRDQQLHELKKYAIFSNVMLSLDDEFTLLGVAGAQSRNALKKIFDLLPNAMSPVIQQENSTILWFPQPIERFILVVQKQNAPLIIENFKNKAQFNNSQQWMLMDIESGIPIIDLETSGRFLPQATNLQALGAINFKKGCYIGQEVISRSTFRNTNQRALYWLSGTAIKIPKTNDALEIKINDHWKRTGIILAVCQINPHKIWVQAILNKNLTPNQVLRVYGDKDSQLKIKKLPYNIHSITLHPH